MESPNTSPQAIKLNPIVRGQAHSNKTGTSQGYENLVSGCILIVIRVPFIFCLLSLFQQGCLINFAQLSQTNV